MNKILLLILFFQGPLAFSQRSYPTQMQLVDALTKRTEQVDSVYKSTTWFTSGKDSSYQKNDTLIFYNDHVYLWEKQICEYVNWSFYKKDALIIQPIQRCPEPGASNKNEDEDYISYTFEVTENKDRLFLQIFNEDKLVDKFEILSLRSESLRSINNERADVMRVKRVKLEETEQ